MACFPKTVPLSSINTLCSPNPGTHALRFGLFPVRSPLLRKSLVIFSSSGYLDVSVPRVPPIWLWIHHTVTGVCPAGFPHSEIDGSKDICSSPSLIAAYHVFHRLLVPRHPPCALVRLTKNECPIHCLKVDVTCAFVSSIRQSRISRSTQGSFFLISLGHSLLILCLRVAHGDMNGS